MYINNTDETKRKLRSLKKLEIKIRFGSFSYAQNTADIAERMKGKRLIWNDFFDINDDIKNKSKSRYSLKDISLMNKENFKNIINEYFFNVYYQYYLENGNINYNLYNPEILKWMGLPPDAEFEDIKKRFRELAKKYHPDTGGDNGKFIELMENYKKLTE